MIKAASRDWLRSGHGYDPGPGLWDLGAKVIDEGVDANGPVARGRIGHQKHHKWRMPFATHFDQPVRIEIVLDAPESREPRG